MSLKTFYLGVEVLKLGPLDVISVESGDGRFAGSLSTLRRKGERSAK